MLNYKLDDSVSVLGSSSVDLKKLHGILLEKLTDYATRRSVLAESWQDCYIQYLASNPDATREQLVNLYKYTGIDEITWRARYTTSKAYELVETVVAYMMGALFPSNKYFDLEPQEPIENPEWSTAVELVRKRIASSLKSNKFSNVVEILIREVAITGQACLLTPWVEGTTQLHVLSPFDYYLDPNSQDPNTANMIRSYEHNMAEYNYLVKEGYYPLGRAVASPSNAYSVFAQSDTIVNRIKTMMGLQRDMFETSKVKVYEFWGDLVISDTQIIYNCYIQYTDTQVLYIGSNPYGDVRPFQHCRYLGLSKSPYGMGVLQPVMGNLMSQNVLLSRRADNVMLQSDQAYMYFEDGVVDPDQAYIAPGNMIAVTRPDAIMPVPGQGANIGVSVQEESMADQRIDKAAGTGPYVAVGAGRSGERVTAEEVKAQKETGGTRLSSRYSFIDSEFFAPFINTYFKLHREYSDRSVLVRIEGRMGGSYYVVTPEDLQLPVKVKTIGAGHVADKEYRTRQFMQFLSMVAANQQMAQSVDWAVATRELAYMLVPDIAEALITEGGSQDPSAMLTPPENELTVPQQDAMMRLSNTGQLPRLAGDVSSNLGLSPQLPPSM